MSGDEKFVSIGELISRITNERIRKEMWQRVDEIEREKVNYERNYFIQYDQFKLHNTKFGGNAKGIKPPEFNAGMDRLLRSEIKTVLAEQKEREQEKLAEKNLSPENKKEEINPTKGTKQKEAKYASAEDFQRLINQIAANKKLPHLSKKVSTTSMPMNKPVQEKTDSRRLAFREQMRALKEHNLKNRDKGLDKE